MGEQLNFIDQIIRGFESIRERPHADVLAAQFASGEIAFLVDHRGIRITSGEDPDDSTGFD